jgi:hypothetical protein
MPTAIPELIAVELVGRLALITTTNGYNFNVASVERANRDGSNLSYKHLSVQVKQEEATRVPELDCPGNPPAIAYEITFTINCISKDSQGETDAYDTVGNDMAAAVVKAITADTSTWYTMNGNAIYSNIGNITPLPVAENEVTGMTVPVLVTYRVAENDPYTVRS